MVVLNCYGIIERKCVSAKLNLYISNLPSGVDNDWVNELKNELSIAEAIDNLHREKEGVGSRSKLIELYSKVFPNKAKPSCVNDSILWEIANNMVCLYVDYGCDVMPAAKEGTNPFEERSCEDDPAEKIIDFINYLSYPYSQESFPTPTPQWIYSSNRIKNDYYRLFWGGERANSYITALEAWGGLFDAMLVTENDFLLLDYIFNSIHKDHEYNEYHLFKSYSLCQLFLEKEKENELDDKLPNLMDHYDLDQRKDMACIMRKLRNKVAHGDFVAFDKEIEKYASKYMDGSFWFDYYEFSRRNWAISHICGELDRIVRKLIYLLFYDREKLNKIRAGLVRNN